MHEMGIANSVLEAVATELKRCPGKRPCKVALRIGELTAIDEDALRFCFEALAKNTQLENVSLEIQMCLRKHRCLACSHEFVVRNYETACPACASAETRCISGDELELAYLEVEDDGTSTAGTQSS
jgi:hydrogenase nickel incorporation protein HypA/HybF